MSPGCFTVGLIVTIVLGLFGFRLNGEVIEEETWYNASGEVVKTVKRTYTGADANRGWDWEPSWIAREERQARALAGNSPRYRGDRVWGGRAFGWGGGFFPVSYSFVRAPVCRVPYRRGVSFSYRGGRWSGAYRSGCRFIGY